MCALLSFASSSVLRLSQSSSFARIGVQSSTAPASKNRAFNKPSVHLSSRHFLNLTNGLEALPHLHSLISLSELRFTRIQSSLCEASAYEKLLLSLDTELLFSLACGRDCYIYDFASRNKQRGVPRSIFLGVQFLRWSLAYLWFAKDASGHVPDCVLVRGKNVVPFWRNVIMAFQVSKDVKKRIRYFAPYAKDMCVEDIKLHGVYGRVSIVDGKKSVHVKLVRDWLDAEALSRGYANEGDEIAKWMTQHGFALYHHDADADELVKVQQWIQTVAAETD